MQWPNLRPTAAFRAPLKFTNASVVFMNIRIDFETVDSSALWYYLPISGVHEQFVVVLMQLNRHTSCRVKTCFYLLPSIVFSWGRWRDLCKSSLLSNFVQENALQNALSDALLPGIELILEIRILDLGCQQYRLDERRYIVNSSHSGPLGGWSVSGKYVLCTFKCQIPLQI